MKTFIGLQGLIIGMGACLSVGIAGCALDPGKEGDSAADSASTDDGASAENIGESTQALTYTSTQDGFKISWTYVGHPYAARKIAACSDGEIFALNDDHRLFMNPSGGSDSGWSLADWPSAAREIACAGGAVYALNADQNLYSYPYWLQDPTWHWVGKPTQAEHIASGNGDIVALNFNKNLYTNPNGSDASWTFRNYAWTADRVTGSTLRAFALNTDKSLWYNDKLLVSQSGANWHPLYNAGLSLLEISARSGTTFFGLTTAFDLWRADIVEDNCSDGIDNDGNGIMMETARPTARTPSASGSSRTRSARRIRTAPTVTRASPATPASWRRAKTGRSR
jgi:hypothetical protein